MSLHLKTASQLSALIRGGECSAVEITKDCFARVGEVEDKVRSYITICEERALKQSAEVDAKMARGEQLSPIAGIPVAVKDNVCTDGLATTCASKMLESYVPPYSATIMERIDSAGAITVGKSNLDEFAMGSSCENSHAHPSHNPWDLSRVPGGSSGGSASAVAAFEAALAIGTDTGGSIRQPSSYCGVVGLKPTYGSVSRYGIVPFASSLDQAGPIARTVEDTALLYTYLCGHDHRDATSVKREYPDFTKLLEGGVKGMTIGVPDEYFGGGISDAVKENIMSALKMLESEGATLKKLSLPSTADALSAYYVISSAEASSNLARFDGVRYGYRAQGANNLADLYERSRSEAFGDEVKRRIMLGTYVLSGGFYDAYYSKARIVKNRVAEEFDAAFKECDLIVTPVTPTGAFKIGEKISDPVAMYATDLCTVTVNIAGLPAISLPCGKDENNMPAGMQIIGRKFSEETIFKAAYHYENLRGGFELPVIK